MKKINLLFLALLFVFFASAQTTSDFEYLPLGTDTFWTGSDLSGGFSSGNAYFENEYDTSFGGYWGGAFIYSSKTDSTTAGYTNEYSAIAGSGVNGSLKYAVGYDYGDMKIRLTQNAAGKSVVGCYVTNTTYAYLSMLNGDAYEHAFTHDSADFFLLKITGWKNGSPINDTINFYLADFRSATASENYIVRNWQWVNLLALGNVDSLIFSLSGSQNGTYGLNTPAYFALDNLVTADVPTQYVTIRYDQDTLIDVLSNYPDTYAGGPFTVHFVSNDIPGASVVVDSANRIWYVPQQGVAAYDTVTYTICNNSNVCDTAQVIINVRAASGITQINTVSARVYPNPFSNSFTVSYDAGVKTIALYNINGQLIQEITCNTGVQTTLVNTGNLPAGMYIVKAISDKGVGVAKITRQ